MVFILNLKYVNLFGRRENLHHHFAVIQTKCGNNLIVADLMCRHFMSVPQ